MYTKSLALIALSSLLLFACTEDEDGFPKWESPDPTASEELTLDNYTGAVCLDPGDCAGKVDLPAQCAKAGCRDGECVVVLAAAGTACTLEGDPVDCQTGVCTRDGQELKCGQTVAPDGTPCALDEWEAPYKVRTCAKGLCGAPTQCAVDQDCGVLEDGNFCNGVLRCVANACVIDPTTLVDCTEAPADLCHEPLCIPETGACGQKPLPNNSACEDGNLCDSGDRCQDGQCLAGATKVTCTEVLAPQCQKASCNPATGTCDLLPGPEGTHCADSNPCMTGDYCKEGTCMPGADLVVCPQEGAGPCREAVCDTLDGSCKFVNLDDSTLCNDGNQCTTVDHCFSGTCSGYSPVDCSGEDVPACQKSTCDPVDGDCKLSNLADETPCDDDEPCTSPDLCLGGECQPGANTCGCPEGASCD